MTEKQRTHLQNRSLHKYCELLACALDDAGHDMRTTITVPIQPTKENVKEYMIRPIMKAMYPDIESTAQLSTVQMQALYRVVDRATLERLSISVPWPSLEEMRRG